MEQKKSILITAAIVASIIFIGTGYEKSAYAQQQQDDGDRKIACYVEGGLLVLAGVPITGVLAAGHAAHSMGVCP